ncbi:hypothetical protein B0H14DRAFT_3746898 [Mycena olivaceomarginata]|nr:hypothetical protein B0H14DRAFT_3746898 [Mycena olivaceomarginata]
MGRNMRLRRITRARIHRTLSPQTLLPGLTPPPTTTQRLMVIPDIPKPCRTPRITINMGIGSLILDPVLTLSLGAKYTILPFPHRRVPTTRRPASAPHSVSPPAFSGNYGYPNQWPQASPPSTQPHAFILAHATVDAEVEQVEFDTLQRRFSGCK